MITSKNNQTYFIKNMKNMGSINLMCYSAIWVTKNLSIAYRLL